MPRIPISQSQVSQKAFQSSGVSASMPLIGGTPGAAEALGGAVDKTISVFEKIKKDAEDVEAAGFENEIIAEHDRLLHDKDSGFLATKRGRDTSLDFDKYSGGFNSYVESKLKDVKSEEVKKKAQAIAENYKRSLDRNLNNHTAREMETYDDQQTKSLLAKVSTHAALNYQDYTKDSSKIKESLDKQALEIHKYAQRKGISSEQIQEMKLRASSDLHSSVINQALAEGNDILAKDYYLEAKNAKQLDPETQEKMEKIINASSVKGESQRYTEMIMSRGVGLGEALDQARKIKDPEVQDEVVRRVRDRWNEEKLVKQETEKAEFDSVVNEFEKYKTIDHLPEEEKMKLSPRKQELLKKASSMVAKGQEPNTDPMVYQDLMLMASRPELRGEFLKKDINEHLLELSTPDRKKFLDMQKSIKEGNGSKYDNDFGQFLSDTQTIGGTLDEIGVTDKEKRAKFQRLVQERAIQWQRENGKKNIPQDTLRKITDDLAMEVTVKGTFWDSKKKLFEVESDEEIVVPDSFLEDIKSRYAREGKVFSEDKARNIYRKMINRK